MKKKIKGFTLIELMVVVAVIGALAAVGVVSYNGYVASTKKKSTINMMMQVALAQTEELTNSGVYWGLTDCSDPTTGSDKSSSTGTSTKAIGTKFFSNAGYIEYNLGYDMCTTSSATGFNIIAQQRAGSCKLELDETTVVTQTNC